jgi:hypothetical protein
MCCVWMCAWQCTWCIVLPAFPACGPCHQVQAVVSVGAAGKGTCHLGHLVMHAGCGPLHACSKLQVLRRASPLLRDLARLPVTWLLPASPLRPGPCTPALQVILRPDGSWPWPGGSLPSKAVETEVRQEAAGILGRWAAGHTRRSWHSTAQHSTAQHSTAQLSLA